LRLSDWRGARWREPASPHPLPLDGLEGPAARILAARGYTDPLAIQRFLEPRWEHLHDPFTMRGLTEAVARIQLARARGESILIYGDYDVDGTTSIVMLTKALEALGHRVSHHVPHRLRDGYGMRPEVVEQAAADGVTLVISVDTGIRAAEVVERARAQGVDVIITDHHLAPSELPRAAAVLNPNAPGCPYPEKNLCGAGVTFKLIQGLLAQSGWDPAKQRRYLESLMKVAALATVADVVPLTGENRVIVRLGLEGFHTLRNLGLRALLRVAGLKEGQPVSAGQIGFRVAPRINAAGRMDHAEAVIRLFLTADEAEANRLAGELNQRNEERQTTEQQILDQVYALGDHDNWAASQAGLVFAGPGWHRGVAGIVASRAVERYCRPAIVLGIEDGIAQGSGRSIKAFDLHQALESMSGLFTKFGGHRQAAGMTLDASRVDEFRRRFNEYAQSVLPDEERFPLLEPDTLVTLPELHDRSAEQLLSLAPFGFGNPAPTLLVRGVELASEPLLVKDRHLRLNLAQNGGRVPAIAWDLAPLRERLTKGTRLDLIVSVEEDAYSRDRGYAFWSVTVRDLRLAQPL
jgi:single-stranded-DNA-specific exonuclease